MPKNFMLVKAPRKLISWISSLLDTLTCMEVSRKVLHRSNWGALIDGNASSPTWESWTNGSKNLTRTKKLLSSLHSQQQSDVISTAQQNEVNSHIQPLEIPSDQFERPSGLTILKIQELMGQAINHCSSPVN